MGLGKEGWSERRGYICDMGTNKVDQTQLDEYVLGILPKDDARALEARIAKDPDLHQQVSSITSAFEAMALTNAAEPPSRLRHKVLSALEGALNKVAQSGMIPFLHEASDLQDLEKHLNRPDVFLPEGSISYHQVILENSPARCTVVVWLKDGFPEETHSEEVERILILEGSCDVQLGDKVHSMRTGDVITIPMHVVHSVKVTCDGWCKAIVQRVAA